MEEVIVSIKLKICGSTKEEALENAENMELPKKGV